MNFTTWVLFFSFMNVISSLSNYFRIWGLFFIFFIATSFFKYLPRNTSPAPPSPICRPISISSNLSSIFSDKSFFSSGYWMLVRILWYGFCLGMMFLVKGFFVSNRGVFVIYFLRTSKSSNGEREGLVGEIGADREGKSCSSWYSVACLIGFCSNTCESSSKE